MLNLKKLILVLLIASVSELSAVSQSSKLDLLPLDSLQHVKDSSEFEILQDTSRLLFSADSSDKKDYSMVGIERELFDHWISKAEYKEFIKNKEDSLIFDKLDSIQYMVYNLRRLINSNNYLLQDTTKQAFDILSSVKSSMI